MTTRQFLCDHNEKGAGAPAGIESGLWRSDSQDLLKRLAQTMRPTTDRSLTATHSLPDIWGYAAFFCDSWEDENHELHDSAVSAWRGLLTLVALREISSLPVTLYSLTQDREKSPFLSAAFRNPPLRLFEPCADAMPLGAVIFHNSGFAHPDVAGLLLPKLLVLPGRDFRFARHKRIAWDMAPNYKGFPLGDPLASLPGPERIKPNQLAALIVFLERMEKNLRELAISDRKYKGVLSPLLNHVTSFLTDAQRMRNARPEAAGVAYEVPTAPLPSSRRAQGALDTVPLRFLDECPRRRPSSATSQETDIAFPFRASLSAAQGASSPLLSPIFYADDMDDSVDTRKLGELRVFDDLFVSESSEQELLGLEDTLRERGHLLILPGHIFEDRLLELQSGDDVHASEYQHHGAGKRFLLPFKPLILAFLSPSEIVQALRVDEDPEGVTVGMRLRLRTSRGDAPVQVARRYIRARDEVRKIGKNLLGTSLQIWPNFQAPDWRIYLLYQSCGKDEDQPMYARVLITESAVAEALSAGARDPASCLEALIERFADERVNRTQLSSNPRKEVIQSQSYVQALQAAVGDDRGLLLCGQIEQSVAPPINPGRSWRIGVDFGASNTCVAYSAEPYNAPALLEFAQDRTVLLTERPGSPRTKVNSDYAAAIYGFLSPNRIVPPFLSLIHERQFYRSTTVPALLSVNRIGYIDKPVDWLDQLCAGGESQYFFGLKWDAAPMARSRVKHFLRQLVLQASAEARARGVNPALVDWRITIPGSLPPNIVGGFQEAATEAVSEITGADVSGAQGVSLPSDQRPASKVKIAFPLESTSAFKYVVDREERLQGSVQVVMDVGGWSTDLAIHGTGGGLPIWEGSLEVGGQHILVDFWKREVQTILEYLSDTRADFASAELRHSAEGPCGSAIVEMLLNDAEIGDSLFRLAEQPGGELSESGRSVLDLIERTKRRADFALFALVDYATYLIEALVRDDLMRLDQRIGFFLCGRGSKLFERALSPQGSRRGAGITTEDRLGKLMGEVERPHRLDGIAFTHHPKSEVALGAVILTDPARAAGGATRRELPLAESLEAETITPSASGKADRKIKRFEESDHLLIADAAKFDNLVCPRLARFGDFVARYNRGFSDSRLSANAAEHTGLIGTLGGLLTRHHGAAVDAPRALGCFQPPFILATRAALIRWDEISEN